VVSGIVVTESGILAAAHLGGAGSKRYLKIMEKNISRMHTDFNTLHGSIWRI
jgi:hypothetical protein